MENPANNGLNPVFRPTLTDEQIAMLVREKYDIVLGICAKKAAMEGKMWRGPGNSGVSSNAQLWILGACLGHASTQETDADLEAAKDREVEKLWSEFADVPMDPETECMEENFLHFPAGTEREDIWRWFDDRHSKGVAHLLGHSPERNDFKTMCDILSRSKRMKGKWDFMPAEVENGPGNMITIRDEFNQSVVALAFNDAGEMV